MTRKAFERKILKLLPSDSLKEAIKEYGHKFSDMDIIKIIHDYGRTFDEKLALFEEAKSIFTDKKVINYTGRVIAHYHKMLNEFSKSDENTAFKVEIQHSATAEADEYITKTFEDAKALYSGFVRYFYRNDGQTVEPTMLCTVTKFSTQAIKKPSDVYYKVGEKGCAELNSRQKITEVTVYDIRHEWSCKNYPDCCEECKKPCLERHVVYFPKFVKKYDLVSFIPQWKMSHITDRNGDDFTIINDGEAQLGVLLEDMYLNDDNFDSTLILLDNYYVKSRTAYQKADGFYRIYDTHDHEPFPLLEKIDPLTLPKEAQDDYAYLVEVLKNLEKDCSEEIG